MPQLITTREKLIKVQKSYKGKTISLVPTMGALHEGHLSLVQKAKELSDIIWVSIFVNPLQFGPKEDLSKYPRALEKDLELLTNLNVDYVWAPNVEEMYKEKTPSIQASPELASRLCGLSRPGHFDGVCTVVKLLFDLIKPNIAIFGEKDYQQLMIISDMVENLQLPIKIIPVATMREASGLAMSSRNQYLNEKEKLLATEIYKKLLYLSSLERITELDLTKAKADLENLEITVEYLEIFWGRILIAAKIGNTRLIDNIQISI